MAKGVAGAVAVRVKIMTSHDLVYGTRNNPAMQEPLGRLRRDRDLFFLLTCGLLSSVDISNYILWLHATLKACEFLSLLSQQSRHLKLLNQAYYTRVDKPVRHGFTQENH